MPRSVASGLGLPCLPMSHKKGLDEHISDFTMVVYF